MQRNQTNMALWGQCIGDAIGRHLLNKKNAPLLWQEYSDDRMLPFKKGKYSVYAQQSLTFVQQYQGKVISDITHPTDELQLSSDVDGFFYRGQKIFGTAIVQQERYNGQSVLRCGCYQLFLLQKRG